MGESGPGHGNRPTRLVGQLHPRTRLDAADFVDRDTRRTRRIGDGHSRRGDRGKGQLIIIARGRA